MPYKYLTTSIGKPAVYFGGALPTDYMRQCTLGSYLENWSSRLVSQPLRADEHQWFLGWQREVSGGDVSHTITYQIPKTALETQDSEMMKLRFVCHVLLDLVTDEGLSELFQSIKDNIEFYEERQKKHVPLLFSKGRTKFKLGEKYERPPFHVVEE